MRTKPTGRRRMPGVLIAVCVAVGLSALPGVAAAEPPHVSPVVDCSRQNDDGSYTLVLGYENTLPTTRTFGLGIDNQLYPERFQGAQPTEFEPGSHPGVFTLRLSGAEFDDFRWELARYTVDRASATSAPGCAPSTPLPALGNGTGLAVALAAGGVFGVFFVRRVVRRSTAPAPVPADVQA